MPDKRLIKATVLNPHQYPITGVPADITSRENEYASMKYYGISQGDLPYDEHWPAGVHMDSHGIPTGASSTYPRSVSHPNFNNNGARPEKEHIYESPESMRRGVADLRGTEMSPPYYDGEPNIRTIGHHTHIAANVGQNYPINRV